MIKKLAKLLLPMALVGTLIAVYKPELVPEPTLAAMANEAHQTIFAQGSIQDGAGWVSLQTRNLFASFAQKARLPKNISTLPEEIVVEEVVSSIGKELKDLPAHQVKKIKANICADVINEAQASKGADE